MAVFSPILGVTKPRIRRPMARPSQNPVAVIPDANASPCRTWITKRAQCQRSLCRRVDGPCDLSGRINSLKTTIHPPSATSIPTYPSRNRAQSQVTRAEGLLVSASRSDPFCDSPEWLMDSLYTVAVSFQNAPNKATSSRIAKDIWCIQRSDVCNSTRRVYIVTSEGWERET